MSERSLNSLILDLLAHSSFYHRREKNRQLIESYNKLSWKPATGWFDFIAEALIISLMISSVVVYFMYVNKMSAHENTFRSKYDAYDADASAPCRYHLLQRSRSNSSDPTLFPGQPGTWTLPPITTELHGVTLMLTQASNLDYLWSAYSLIVSAVILLMMINLIRLVGFQPRLSVIAASLHLMSEDLFHLLLIFVAIAVPLAIQVVILVGSFNVRARDFTTSFLTILTMFVTGGNIVGVNQVFDRAIITSNQVIPIMSVVIYATLFFIVFIVIWVLRMGVTLVIIM